MVSTKTIIALALVLVMVSAAYNEALSKDYLFYAKASYCSA